MPRISFGLVMALVVLVSSHLLDTLYSHVLLPNTWGKEVVVLPWSAAAEKTCPKSYVFIWSFLYKFMWSKKTSFVELIRTDILLGTYDFSKPPTKLFKNIPPNSSGSQWTRNRCIDSVHQRQTDCKFNLWRNPCEVVDFRWHCQEPFCYLFPLLKANYIPVSISPFQKREQIVSCDWNDEFQTNETLTYFHESFRPFGSICTDECRFHGERMGAVRRQRAKVQAHP